MLIVGLDFPADETGFAESVACVGSLTLEKLASHPGFRLPEFYVLSDLVNLERQGEVSLLIGSAGNQVEVELALGSTVFLAHGYVWVSNDDDRLEFLGPFEGEVNPPGCWTRYVPRKGVFEHDWTDLQKLWEHIRLVALAHPQLHWQYEDWPRTGPPGKECSWRFCYEARESRGVNGWATRYRWTITPEDFFLRTVWPSGQLTEQSRRAFLLQDLTRAKGAPWWDRLDGVSSIL